MGHRDRLSTIHDEQYRAAIRTLTHLREQAGLTQATLGAAIGLSQPDVSKIERFERRLDLLEALAWVKAASETPDQAWSDIFISGAST